MATVNIYLHFNGNCEEAFNFYKEVFGGDFSMISRFKDMPPGDKMPPLPPEYADKIMHVALPISNETVLMGSDVAGEWSQKFVPGTNFSISVNDADLQEAQRIFNRLSEGGEVLMPFEKAFWGSHFGMLNDKFGINWMVSCEEQK
ncbi:MAG: VOC family protein [Calditrichia bacterium]